LAGAPAYDPLKQSASAQALQFGYNNDYLGLHPLPAGSTSGDRSCWWSTTSTSIPT
jgi:secreted PhoX family phosphatase